MIFWLKEWTKHQKWVYGRRVITETTVEQNLKSVGGMDGDHGDERTSSGVW